MKALYKKILPLILSFNILIVSFFSCSLSVYAGVTIPDDYVAPDIIAAVELSIEQKNFRYFANYLYDSADGLIFLLSQMGAVVTLDFPKWVENNKALESLVDITPVKKEDDNIVFTKELFEELKKILDEYVKTEQTKEENGGFYLLPTTKFDTLDASNFASSSMYHTFRNIMAEKGMLSVRTNYRSYLYFTDPFSDPDHPQLLYFTGSQLNQYLNYPENRVVVTLFCANDWVSEQQKIMRFPEQDQIYHSCSDANHINTGNSGYTNETSLNGYDSFNYSLYSTTGERVRVFISSNAAKNYSVGNRKIYFSENYYNYEPEDLTVAIDDLQKSVDDLQKIIDELLEKIGNDTSEKEIEELLRQILEEIRKNPGGGGGESSGGDVTVSVDLKETNSWLSKIYNRLGDILSKISGSAENAYQDALDGIQSKLDEISETLKKIRNWTAVDTVIDGVDAVADWLDLIRDVLKDGAGSAVSALSSALQDSTDLMKQKFPFSIPWDILFFVTVFSAEPETPHFVIPIDIDMEWVDINIHYDFVLDFSQFQWLSDLSRLILSMTYAAGLMKKTVDIVSANKEG